jgi:hypothetical protein
MRTDSTSLDLIASFQRTAIEMLFDKTLQEPPNFGTPNPSRVRRCCL